MLDPVTQFEYPEEWVKRCREPEALKAVRGGLAVLTADGVVRRRGFTTGTTAAAACLAAILSIQGAVSSVLVRTACGLEIGVNVVGGDGKGSCRKYPGDYPEDATANIEFRAEVVRFQERSELEVRKGIGRWDRDTPRFRRSEPAISMTAMSAIMNAIEKGCAHIGKAGALIALEAVDGERVASNTLNPRLGIVGGISVLGSTGLVEPWDDHLGEERMEQVRNSERVVITTGRVGLAHARRRYPEHDVVLVGANIGQAVEAARGDLILFGLPALILKFIDPDILRSTEFRTVEELVASDEGPDAIARAIEIYRERYPGKGIVLIDRQGGTIGEG